MISDKTALSAKTTGDRTSDFVTSPNDNILPLTLNTYGHLYKEQKRDVNKRVLNAWEASLRDVRGNLRDNLLAMTGD